LAVPAVALSLRLRLRLVLILVLVLVLLRRPLRRVLDLAPVGCGAGDLLLALFRAELNLRVARLCAVLLALVADVARVVVGAAGLAVGVGMLLPPRAVGVGVLLPSRAPFSI